MKLKEQIETSAYRAAQGMDVPWVLRQWAERTPDKTCVVFCPFEGEERRLSYAELLGQAQRLAAGLAAKGVKPGDFILLHMDNSVEFILCWYACAILGAVAVSTNTRSVARDLSYFMEVTQAACALTQPKHAQLIGDACPGLGFIAVAERDSEGSAVSQKAAINASGGIPFADLFCKQPLPLRAPDPMLNLSVQFTSGTTSRPKAVLWTHANGVWAGRVSAQHFRLRHSDVTLVYLPLFHTNAQGYSMLATHWSGGTIVVQPRFSASRFWKLAVERKVTWASMIPFAIRAIHDQPVPKHQMRLWALGAHIPVVDERFGVETLGLWGMTETLTQGIVTDPSHLGPHGTMGRAAPEYDIQVRRPDGALAAPGERGRLYIRGVRGVSLFKEYYGNKEATAKAFDADGWLDTGDVIRSDEAGWLYFMDRDKDMLKVGAENVAASEVETVIMQTGLAHECAVVGQKHQMLDEVPVAFIIPSPKGRQLPEAELIDAILAHCRESLPDFKTPRAVHQVEELPRSTLEKVAKNVLRDRLPPITA